MYNDSHITKKRILFCSDLTLSNMLETLRYEKVDQKYFKDTEGSVDDGPEYNRKAVGLR